MPVNVYGHYEKSYMEALIPGHSLRVSVLCAVSHFTSPYTTMELASGTEENTKEATSVYVFSYVAFGDIEDIIRKRIKKSSSGDTISFTMETRRKFVPGKYFMKKLRGDNRIDTVIYHSTVDPRKIRNLLFHCNVGTDHTEKNYLNRYDWMRARNWKGETTCFFVPEENIHRFIEAERPNSFGFTIDLGWKKLQGDWIYGCLLEDINTGRCFALVVEEMYTNISLGGDVDSEITPLLPELEGMSREDLKFDINRLKVDAIYI